MAAQKQLRTYTPDSHGVLLPLERRAFSYSDGQAAEARVSKLVAQAKDRSVLSPEMLEAGTDWVSRYHLSPQRAHLMRPLQGMLHNKMVLELGAGCGAITRFLGETAKRVIALEGSPIRARIAAARCHDLQNVTVISDTIQQLSLPQKFDVVTLIGVLEYARQFDDESPSPERTILRIAREFLKPGGHLIIAMENKLGLKYFAGAKEDHVQKPYFGIHNLYGKDTVVTFGKKEMEDLLHEAGFPKLEQLIPLPDYKMPVTVVHPAATDGSKPGVDLVPLLLNSLIYDWQKPSRLGFSLEAACRPIVENGLIRDVCNSLFFVASVDENAEALDPDILVSHYGGARYKEFARETRFIRKDNAITVNRRYLVSDAPHEKQTLRNSAPENEPYSEHPVFHEGIVRILNTPGWTKADISAWAKPWVEYLQNAAEPSENGLVLPSSYMDSIPFNFFLNPDGSLTQFDVEWDLADESKLSLAYVAVRGLYNSFAYTVTVAPPAPDTPLNFIALALQVLAEFDISMDPEKVLAFAEEYGKLSVAALGKAVNIQSVLENALTTRVLA